MARSVLAEGQEFRFKDLVLHEALESWEDDIPVRLASYEYLKRDGGEQEPMGAGAQVWIFRCCFIGPDCGRRYRALAASIQKEPRGQLVHPRLGTFNAACRGIKGRENPATAIDAIDFSIEFVENQVDQSIQADQQFGVQRRSSDVSFALTEATAAVSAVVSNRIANTVYAAATAAMVTFSVWGNRFAAAALEAAQNDAPDITLDKLLGNVLQKRDLALTALTATLVKTLDPDIRLTDARTAIYIAYAACVQLYAVVLAQKPPVVDVPIPMTMTLTAILVRIYGADARAKRAEAFLLNRIPTPYAIPGGTVLRLTAPRVRQ